MQYYNWNMQCPYAAIYSNSYPAVRRSYHSVPWSIDPADLEGMSRAQRDVERVLPMIYQRAANEINQAVAMGMSPALVAYLIREMVQYIDRNYDKYSLSASYNITESSDDIKTQLYWIFNIFRIYGVPFEVQKSLLNTTVITAIRNLRVPPQNVTAASQ